MIALFLKMKRIKFRSLKFFIQGREDSKWDSDLTLLFETTSVHFISSPFPGKSPDQQQSLEK